MPTVSLCMIVKNEESVLSRCLQCAAAFADEIVIVDTGSNDRTKEIAAEFTDKIYDFEGIDDFSEARNFSFSKANGDYIMWLDADDVIDEENQKKLVRLKNTLDASVDVVMMKYNIAFDSDGNPTFSYYRERLVKRSRGFKWRGAVHEAITPSGNIIYSDIAVLHKKLKVNDPDRNLNIFKKLINSGKTLDTRQKFYYARELYYHGLYAEAERAFKDFFAQNDRWTENSISACLDISKCLVQMGRTDEALESLFKSFLYDSPRAEICCEIGNIKLDKGKYREAVFWYEAALKSEPPAQNGGFSDADCHGYLPSIQLCVCYDRLGKYKKAYEYNEKAGSFKPNDKSYLANKIYFQQRFKDIP